MKNNKPKYVIIEFDEFSKEVTAGDKKVEEIANRILYENIQAFKELAK